MSTRYAKVKAMGLFVSNGRILATAERDSVKGEDYLRLLGGSVEFGERSDEALRRELREEIGAEIGRLALLDVIENIYTFEGWPGHEIAFLYRGVFTDPSFCTREQIPFIEAGKSDIAVWTKLEDVLTGKARLYPPADYAKLFKLVEEQKP
jgi:8-oxo-dGTP pyrophosphatase MutT (NUDIX family)